ncbi:hypothetical protein GCM10010502_00450 [Kitasatospora aureofaciens]|uniref:DUF6924 domain-containing protein n=2 Tax=Kitasatospora aureofaciens TaxID=1894 RepID=A0A8H9LJU3_KITAU|nr:hypothetical protein B6264_22535 [Kitasatospora aureofaciens]GGU54324.1 hypothetical protein GCM10010502_00450 [Kitasatospora aureofaciens]
MSASGETIPPMPLPQPDDDLTSLVLRTDFGDDEAWDALRTALDAADEYTHATYVSDLRFAGVSVRTLLDEEAAADEDDRVIHLFLADPTAMEGPEHPLLAVDLADEPGRTFRVPARWFPDVSANLSIANMDFAEFADAADRSGTFRGFEGTDAS